MSTVSRRSVVLAAVAAAAAASARAVPALAGPRAPLPPLPLLFSVARAGQGGGQGDGGAPAVDDAWIDAQLTEMESLLGPLGVHPTKVAVRLIHARHANLETRADRDALAAEVRPSVVNVFVVSTLMDVDEPPRMRRGVHWRSRPHPDVRYVILASEAMPTVLAHEMGHYFGLGHSRTTDNLMSYDRTGGPVFVDGAQGRAIVDGARRAFESGELAAPHRP